MKTYKITFEITLKNDDTDWITGAIEDCLENSEYCDVWTIEEVLNNE